MKIAVLIPASIEDVEVRNCLQEIIRQTNAALDELNNKYEEIRRNNNGKSDN